MWNLAYVHFDESYSAKINDQPTLNISFRNVSDFDLWEAGAWNSNVRRGQPISMD